MDGSIYANKIEPSPFFDLKLLIFSIRCFIARSPLRTGYIYRFFLFLIIKTINFSVNRNIRVKYKRRYSLLMRGEALRR